MRQLYAKLTFSYECFHIFTFFCGNSIIFTINTTLREKFTSISVDRHAISQGERDLVSELRTGDVRFLASGIHFISFPQ
jgi:hypothetical protein